MSGPQYMGPEARDPRLRRPQAAPYPQAAPLGPPAPLGPVGPVAPARSGPTTVRRRRRPDNAQ